jgi:hypothetical protein
MWLVARKKAGGLGGSSTANLSGPRSAQEPPTMAEPCAALCSLQVYKILALFWEFSLSRLLADGERPCGWSAIAMSIISLALGL